MAVVASAYIDPGQPGLFLGAEPSFIAPSDANCLFFVIEFNRVLYCGPFLVCNVNTSTLVTY